MRDTSIEHPDEGTSIDPAEVQVVLQGEPRLRVLGTPLHVLNARVARRAGASLVERIPATGHVLVVPSLVAIDKSLFDVLRRTSTLIRLVTPDNGPALIWGPAPLVRHVLEGERPTPIFRTLPRAAAFDVSSRSRARQAEWFLLRQTAKPTDGFVSRHINRPISRVFSYLMLRVRLRPIHASFVSLLIGLACAWFAAQPGWLALAIAGVLFQAASIFDGVDGEMARATLTESPLGAKIDTSVDNVTYLACLAGFFVGWAREGLSPVSLALAALIAIGVPLTLLQVLQFVRRYAPSTSFVFFDICIRRAAASDGSWPLKTVALVFRAFRRDFFALLFMLLGFTGSRSLIVGLLGAGLVIANLTLITYRPRLVAAAKS